MDAVVYRLAPTPAPAQRFNSPCRWKLQRIRLLRIQNEGVCFRKKPFNTLSPRDPRLPMATAARCGRFQPSDALPLAFGRKIPSLFIRAIKVVRFSPNRAAAPLGPPITHSAAPNV